VRRTIFNIVAIALLVVSILAAALWVRSESAIEDWDFLARSTARDGSKVIRVQVLSVNGGLGVMIPGSDMFRFPAGSGPPLGIVSHWRSGARPSPTAYPYAGMARDWPWHGFVFEHLGVNLPPSAPPLSWYITLPYWFILGVTMPLPCVGALRLRRRIGRQPGQCRACGYDLRATPSRCPECGSEVSTSTE